MSRILVYHTVESYDYLLPAGIDCPASVFADQMETLSVKWRVIPLQELFDSYLVKQRRIPSDVLSITFDDGYMDNFTNAFPVLKAFGFPATIFCVTSEIGKQWPAEDWKGVPKKMLDELTIKEMSDNQISFESHGNCHHDLTQLDDEMLLADLELSQNTLKKITGTKPRFLSYPFGATDERVESIVKELGFDGAFTVWCKNSNRYSLNRLPLHFRDRGLRFQLKLKWYDFLKPILARFR